MQIFILYGTRSAAASGKSLYRVEMSEGSLSYARDLLRVARENPLVSYPILDPWQDDEMMMDWEGHWGKCNRFHGICFTTEENPGKPQL